MASYQHPRRMSTPKGRWFPNRSRTDTRLRRIKVHIPDVDSVRTVYITRAQWERSSVIHGKPAKEVSAGQMTEQINLRWVTRRREIACIGRAVPAPLAPDTCTIA